MQYVSSRKAKTYYGVCDQTLRNWADEGKIEFILTKGNQRRYKIIKEDSKVSVIYGRVSSKKQEKDLDRQIEYLRRMHPRHKIIRDIGSGINYKREGFRWILEQLFKGNLRECVVASGDRFSGFGTDLFEWIFEQFEAKLVILDDQRSKSKKEEFAEDLMEIITVFTARYHGTRNYDQKSEILSERSSENSD